VACNDTVVHELEAPASLDYWRLKALQFDTPVIPGITPGSGPSHLSLLDLILTS
jgi:hypothetical protein